MNESSSNSPTRYLGDYVAGHDNNFKLLRFIAALLVLVTHSFALSTGQGNSEPLRSTLGITLGSIAVDIFFVTSGFLVTGSLLHRQSLRGFLTARALRIVPALWVSLVLTVLILGAAFTTLSAPAFFAESQTWKFLARNGFLLRGLVWELPATFLNNPAKGTINGSLWSLPAEVQMYLLLAAMWLSAGWLRIDKVKWVSRACVALSALGVGLSLAFYRDGAQGNLVYLGAMFFSGAALQVLRERIVVSCLGVVAACIALVLAAILDRAMFGVLYRVLLPYLVLYLALVPAGKIRRFNVVGDYSYGLYIYAFPVQQALASLWHGIDPYAMMGTSFIITMVFAVSSWHVVEKRALALKGQFS